MRDGGVGGADFDRLAVLVPVGNEQQHGLADGRRHVANRIAGHFAGLKHNNDRRNYTLAQAVLEGKHTYLRKGLVR